MKRWIAIAAIVLIVTGVAAVLYWKMDRAMASFLLVAWGMVVFFGGLPVVLGEYTRRKAREHNARVDEAERLRAGPPRT